MEEEEREGEEREVSDCVCLTGTAVGGLDWASWRPISLGGSGAKNVTTLHSQVYSARVYVQYTCWIVAGVWEWLTEAEV